MMENYLIIISPRLGETSYVTTKARSEDQATDIAVNQLISGNAMLPEESESCSVIGVFKGQIECVSWEG